MGKVGMDTVILRGVNGGGVEIGPVAAQATSRSIQRIEAYLIPRTTYLLPFQRSLICLFNTSTGRRCHQCCTAHQRFLIEIELGVMVAIIQMFFRVVRANKEITSSALFPA